MGRIETKFKQTEVGLIPEDWKIRTLGKVLKVKHGKSQKDVEEKNGKYPILGTGGLMSYANKYLYNKSSVLIGRKGTINKPQFMDTPFWTVDTLFYTEIFEDNLPKFIYYKFLQVEWCSYNEASGVPSLNAKTIEKIELSFPPTKTEQTAIANALSDADLYIESLEKLIAKKQKIKQGAMQQLLKPKPHWEIKKLGEIAEIYTGKKNNQDKVDDGLYPFFVRSQAIERINSYSFEGEAILIPGEGNIGKIFHYIDGKFDYHQRVYKISDFKKGYFPKYIYRYISEYFGRHALENSVKAAVDSLRLPTFQVFEIPFPPTLEEQEEIAQTLSDIDSEITTLTKKLTKAKAIKQGMMQQLLTGKIRLI